MRPLVLPGFDQKSYGITPLVKQSKNLLPHIKTIYFTQGRQIQVNTLYQEYSSSTNVDQILQKRERDEFGVSIYARDENGNTLTNGEKRGVPLSDVWDNLI